MFKSQKQRQVSWLVFGIYILLLIWLVLFKFTTNISEMDHFRSINLIPFYYDKVVSIHFKEVLYNILVFVPLGVYLSIFKENWISIKKIIVVFFVSLFLEIVQFIFSIGASDITDIIGNTLGGIIGIILFILLKRTMRTKYNTLINVLGLIIEIMAVGMITLLTVANR